MSEQNDEKFNEEFIKNIDGNFMNKTTDEMLEEYDDAEIILDDEDMYEPHEVYGDFYKKISNGEESVILYKNNKGDVHSDEENEDSYIGNVNDNDFDDKLEEFEEEWNEIHWTTQDYADHFGCEVNEVEDVMQDYLDK